jgi:hypothetical protein
MNPLGGLAAVMFCAGLSTAAQATALPTGCYYDAPPNSTHVICKPPIDFATSSASGARMAKGPKGAVVFEKKPAAAAAAAAPAARQASTTMSSGSQNYTDPDWPCSRVGMHRPCRVWTDDKNRQHWEQL